MVSRMSIYLAFVCVNRERGAVNVVSTRMKLWESVIRLLQDL